MQEIKFSNLEAFCDDPALPSEVKAILAPDNEKGFGLVVSVGTTKRRVVSAQRRPLYFRTIEIALARLIDVPNLSRQIVLDVSRVPAGTL